jgi:hypothetical protein
MMSDSSKKQDEMMNCGLSIQERDVLQQRLRELEDTPPPRAVWQRIEEQARAEGLFTQRVAERTKWLAGAGLAAAVVLAVLNVPVSPLIDSGQEQFPTEPEYAATTTNGEDMRALNALMVRSQQIERNLRALPEQPSVVRASTVATISELEDQVAAIDYLLAHPELQLSAEQQETYWRERVRLMNSLLQLRAAQAQRVSF